MKPKDDETTEDRRERAKMTEAEGRFIGTATRTQKRWKLYGGASLLGTELRREHERQSRQHRPEVQD